MAFWVWGVGGMRDTYLLICVVLRADQIRLEGEFDYEYSLYIQHIRLLCEELFYVP
jgi:hypothetical protein